MPTSHPPSSPEAARVQRDALRGPPPLPPPVGRRRPGSRGPGFLATIITLLPFCWDPAPEGATPARHAGPLELRSCPS